MFEDVEFNDIEGLPDWRRKNYLLKDKINYLKNRVIRISTKQDKLSETLIQLINNHSSFIEGIEIENNELILPQWKVKYLMKKIFTLPRLTYLNIRYLFKDHESTVFEVLPRNFKIKTNLQAYCYQKDYRSKDFIYKDDYQYVKDFEIVKCRCTRTSTPYLVKDKIRYTCTVCGMFKNKPLSFVCSNSTSSLKPKCELSRICDSCYRGGKQKKIRVVETHDSRLGKRRFCVGCTIPCICCGKKIPPDSIIEPENTENNRFNLICNRSHKRFPCGCVYCKKCINDILKNVYREGGNLTIGCECGKSFFYFEMIESDKELAEVRELEEKFKNIIGFKEGERRGESSDHLSRRIHRDAVNEVRKRKSLKKNQFVSDCEKLIIEKTLTQTSPQLSEKQEPIEIDGYWFIVMIRFILMNTNLDKNLSMHEKMKMVIEHLKLSFTPVCYICGIKMDHPIYCGKIKMGRDHNVFKRCSIIHCSKCTCKCEEEKE
jgi:hypothetical protein